MLEVLEREVIEVTLEAPVVVPLEPKHAVGHLLLQISVQALGRLRCPTDGAVRLLPRLFHSALVHPKEAVRRNLRVASVPFRCSARGWFVVRR